MQLYFFGPVYTGKIIKNVIEREKLFIGAGNRVSKFFLSPETLIKLSHAEVLDLT